MENLPECCNPFKINQVKSEIPNQEDLIGLSELFSSLGDINRLKMLIALSKQSLCVHELAATIDASTSAVSHQLRKLKDRNLVSFQREGQVKYYFLADQRLREILSQLLKPASLS